MPRPPAPIQDSDRLIGKNIRSIRQDRHMCQSELAARIGLSHSMLSKIENGQTRICVDCLTLVAYVLDVTPAEFFATLTDSAQVAP